MTLRSKSRAISIAFGTVSFFMTDGARTVRVDVDQSMLARLEDPVLRTRSAYKERLLRNLRRYSRIASQKYRAGSYKNEVRVRVVTITLDDLAEASSAAVG
jgi:hypothetical protein